MKKNFKIKILFAVAALSVFPLYAGKDEVISVKDLPEKITAYVKTHFPELTIMRAVKDKDGLSFTYEVKLNDKTELEFTSAGEIKSIDGKGKLPDSVISGKILSYVKENYPENYITDLSIGKKSDEVELNNGIELKFGKNGSFIKADN